MRISFKLALVFFLFSTCACGLTSYVLYCTASAKVMEDIRQRLGDIVAIAPQIVDSQIHEKLQQPSQEAGSDYMIIKRALQKVRDASLDIHFIYTMRQSADGQIVFVVDAEENSEDMAHLGKVYDEASPLLRQVFTSRQNKPRVEEQCYTDQWGTWLSGYAPIFNAKGVRVGVLGVDISAAKVAAYKREFMKKALSVFGLLLPLFLLAGYWVGRRISLPIVAAKEGAERIGSGDLNARIHVSSDDELGVLVDSMNRMAENLGRNRDKLTEVMEKYRSIFEGAADGIFQSSPDGKFVTVNPAMADILGYASPEEVMENVTDMSTMLYARAEDYERIVRTLELEGQIKGMQTRFLRKGGSTVDVELTILMRRLQNGMLLEGMVKDITQRLAREQAEKDRMAAEASSSAKSEFLANMSHEIRTPMNAIMGFTDLMLRGDIEEKQRITLGKIKGASQTLLAVINDILDFSKIEAGRMELEVTDFSLHETMANLSEMFSQKAHERDIEFMVSIAEGTPSALCGDPVRLGQVLINLLGNALKFTEKGEVVVEVRPAREQPADDEHVMLEFAVVDTGVGIPKERLGSVFDSFSQADTSTTRKFGGTGLGLTICRQLTELMGGSIHVESVPGQGSRFVFTACFGRQPEDRELRLSAPKDLRGLKVLVVDDNETSREILVSAINSFQMEAATAASGQEALQAMQKASPPFDLVLMDWKMPGMNGLETARNIKEKLKLNKVPIICMVSAYGREDLLRQSDRNFLDAFLHKPVNQSFLFDSIMELFGHSEALVTERERKNETSRTPAHLNGAKALLVEDNAINREVAREWLSSAGIIIEEADNGIQAIERLEAMAEAGELPDVVLMDIQMPELDGLETTRRLRRDERFAALPIIAMTAHALKGDRERCLDAGMDDYVTKPIDPDALFQALGARVSDKGGIVAQEQPAVVAASETGDAEALAELNLSGVDVEEGLFRCNSNARLYRRLLGSFLVDYAGADREIARFVEAGSQPDAHRVAHSAKGMAGSLGARRLQAAALTLETAAREGQLETEGPAWDEFVSALTEVAVSLDQAGFGMSSHDSTPEKEEGSSVIGREELVRHLDVLERALDDDLDLARNLVETIREAVNSITGGDEGTRLGEHVENFELDEAGEVLGHVREFL